MRIESTNAGGSDAVRVTREKDLRGLLTLLRTTHRPCPGCQITEKERLGRCGWDCPDAPAMLSSDPVRFPIEPGIVPLVFELSRTGALEPCWSCEGHLDHTGTLTRAPQVWFTTQSAVHAELVACHLADLRAQSAIEHTWRLSVCPVADAGATTFMILPDAPDNSGKAALSRMRLDLREIARGLETAIERLATEAIRPRNPHSRHTG